MMEGIAVLVSTRVDCTSNRLTRNPADAAAVAMALAIDPAAQLLTVGEMAPSVAESYLALGVQTLSRCSGEAASALAQAARGAALVFAGGRGEGEIGSGLLPYQVAHLLGYPLIDEVVGVEGMASGWLVRQALPKGARRRLHLQGPAVLVLSERAPPALRHSHRAALQGKVLNAEASAPETLPPPSIQPLLHPLWQRQPYRRQLSALEGPSLKSGHERMLRATGNAQSGAATLLQQGSAEDKAQALLQHLRLQRLINF